MGVVKFHQGWWYLRTQPIPFHPGSAAERPRSTNPPQSSPRVSSSGLRAHRSPGSAGARPGWHRRAPAAGSWRPGNASWIRRLRNLGRKTQLGQSQDKLVTADRGRSRVRPLATSNQRRPARAPPGLQGAGPAACPLSPPISSAPRRCLQRSRSSLRAPPSISHRPALAIGSVFSQSKPSDLIIQ